ncbi:hypothetical protein AB4090_02360 [Acidithiobacillus sp. IBUN Pt1247-S3]|uniref:hypothetical protein n=1 Tax=Acidithiobacillus sp. IBUN Pt1247-S3 TaxID=3166642 RepID=UPI0034E4A1D6
MSYGTKEARRLCHCGDGSSGRRMGWTTRAHGTATESYTKAVSPLSCVPSFVVVLSCLVRDWQMVVCMGVPINLSRLGPIYNDAMEHNRGTIAFEVPFQNGLFVFMMFFEQKTEAGENSKDILFLYLRRSKQLLERKLYGSHKNGVFNIYTDDDIDKAVRDELEIQGGGRQPFDLRKFFQEINNAIPDHIDFGHFRKTLRENFPVVNRKYKIVDDAEKTHLIGPRLLPPDKHPREQTLRKLYIFIEADKDTVGKFISILKQKNVTLAWSSKEKPGVTIETLMRDL